MRRSILFTAAVRLNNNQNVCRVVEITYLGCSLITMLLQVAIIRQNINTCIVIKVIEPNETLPFSIDFIESRCADS